MGWLSHFALQLMRQFLKVHPDFEHWPDAAQLGQLALLSAHLKPMIIHHERVKPASVVKSSESLRVAQHRKGDWQLTLFF